ncbi:LysR family transcriptional regulator [Aeromonas veronii]|uniref:LysR family transcriptional regulator n=1 Tax=Aeromonas veronii TaxID=654 RepID=UPI0015CFE7D9|nr:LysR family transcriptional regulator [Aeromonas veronii]QLH67451.1 LysR family transcriptional regulator [Aeromonas veronii]
MLDPLLLRSFVAIIDTGSFTRAGERVHLTQSTISQQIRRLEQQLGCPLLDRSGRQVVATAEGEKLLGLARRILALLAQAEEQVSEGSVSLSLGVPEDFAAGAITPVLAAFARDYPEVRLEVQSGLSHEIWQRFEAGELDLALVKQVRGQGSPLASWSEPLDGLGRRWRIAYVSASLASLQGAVSAGIGVSLLPKRLMLADQLALTQWPKVASVELALHVAKDGGEPLSRLSSALIALCDEVMGPQ